MHCKQKIAQKLDNNSTTHFDALTQDIEIVDQISSSRYPILLAFSPKQKKHFAMKMFRYLDNKINPCFIREARFQNLKHPNLVKIEGSKLKQKFHHKGENFEMSVLLMELAFGDFADLIENKLLCQNEKLLRTYFHHLINGIEFMHSQGIAHLDIKPENLLLGRDFNLKISDFDLSFSKEDLKITGRGTSHYRPPELREERCFKPMMADIYSIGITLFVMKTGFLPYYEDQIIGEFDLQNLLYNDVEGFWAAHESINPEVAAISEEFRDLFIKMTRNELSDSISCFKDTLLRIK